MLYVSLGRKKIIRFNSLRSLKLHYMASGLWTPDHYTYVWEFSKLLPQLYRMSLNAVLLEFPFTRTNGKKTVPVCQC